MLDLFCGRWGWSRAFAARGWECVGVDLVEPPEVPRGCTFFRGNVLELSFSSGNFWLGEICLGRFDFGCASSSCEQFSVHGMKHFHPNPPYPELGIKLFNHTRSLCEASGVPYVMENVRPAQQFVGNAVNHCGPFYLWGTGVPPILPQGISKGLNLGSGQEAKRILKEEGRAALVEYRKKTDVWWPSGSAKRIANTSRVATIPPELSACVADYAMRLMEVPA